jgi:hypothetical protein
MSTRARIAIKTQEGKLKSIYCHFDGNTYGVGEMLHEHYREQEKVENLIELGDISFLEKEIIPTEPHSFKSPQKGVTVFYGRDRGEQNTGYLTHFSEENLLREDASYNYIFQEGEWYLLKRDYRLILLKDLIS